MAVDGPARTPGTEIGMQPLSGAGGKTKHGSYMSEAEARA